MSQYHCKNASLCIMYSIYLMKYYLCALMMVLEVVMDLSGVKSATFSWLEPVWDRRNSLASLVAVLGRCLLSIIRSLLLLSLYFLVFASAALSWAAQKSMWSSVLLCWVQTMGLAGFSWCDDHSHLDWLMERELPVPQRTEIEKYSVGNVRNS